MPIRRKPYGLDQSPLFRLTNRGKLAALLDITPSELRGLSKSGSLYTEFEAPKKSGDGTRHVENPRRPLKLAQAKIARLLSRITPPDYLFCPVKRRCYVTNAARHQGNRVVRCLDIHKYFPSTSSRRVFWFYRSVMKCEADIAGLLTALSTYQGHLPTGSPLSPILSYFAHYDVWQAIAALCKRHGHILTVYVDDITISGAKVTDAQMWEVQRIIHGAGLRYHKEKRYIGSFAEITGVIITNERIVPPHRQHLKLFTAQQSLRGISDEAEIAKLRAKISGMKGQMRQIETVNNLMQEMGAISRQS